MSIYYSWPQFDNNEAWAPGLNFPALNRTSQPIPSFHDNFNAPYIPPNQEVVFAFRPRPI